MEERRRYSWLSNTIYFLTLLIKYARSVKPIKQCCGLEIFNADLDPDLTFHFDVDPDKDYP
jgi:hypothetical protein